MSEFLGQEKSGKKEMSYEEALKRVPSFLRRENAKKPTEEDVRIDKALKRYEEHFGMGLSTESLPLNPDEWEEFIDECIAQNKDEWEIFGIEYDPECDY